MAAHVSSISTMCGITNCIFCLFHRKKDRARNMHITHIAHTYSSRGLSGSSTLGRERSMLFASSRPFQIVNKNIEARQFSLLSGSFLMGDLPLLWLLLQLFVSLFFIKINFWRAKLHADRQYILYHIMCVLA